MRGKTFIGTKQRKINRPLFHEKIKLVIYGEIKPCDYIFVQRKPSV